MALRPIRSTTGCQRRHCGWSQWCIALAALAAATRVLASEPPPNLILISIDTLRADHLGCYGYARPTSPAIDGLASGGVLFTDVSAPSPWTRPSHASLLTGDYPSRHGVRTHAARLGTRVPTLASILASAGYRTAAIVNSENLGRAFGLDRGFAELDYVSEWSSWPWRKRIVDRGAAIVDRALSFLDGAAAARFFLFLHFYDPHSDYDSAPEYLGIFARPYAGSVDGSTDLLLAAQRGERRLSSADGSHLVDLYDAEIRQLDTELGRLFDRLATEPLRSRTVVALTSDHGEEFLDHGSVLHGHTMYQELLSVPLLLRGPGLPAPLRVGEPVSLVDVAPTLLSALGVRAAAPMDGIDVGGSWASPPRALPERVLFGEADHADAKRMARSGRWKLHSDGASRTTALYDLASDRGEHRDRAGEEPGRVRALLEALERHAAGAVPIDEVTPDAASRERMRALGYAPRDD